MSSIDGTYSPFDEYPSYQSMAPCMRSCDHEFGYNGCDQARCWCKKANLDLRIGSITRCASTSCTFANMNTETDVSIISGVQVMYCADRGFSPEGMTMPSTADATPTESIDSFPTTTATITDSGSRTRPASGPSATSGDLRTSITSNPPSSTSGSSQQSSSNSGSLSTATKAGIGIGAAFCALLAILILLLLFRRRKPKTQYFPPPPAQNNFQNGPPPPQMAPTPYSGNGPFSPPPVQQSAPIHPPPQAGGYTKGDVSPIEEKAPALPATAAAINRKEVGSGNTKSELSSPTPSAATPVPQSVAPKTHPDALRANEVHGSIPSPRHEVSNDGQITNTASTRGMELDAQQNPVHQYPGQGQYQQSPQGQWAYNYQGGPPAQELAGGQPGHELASGHAGQGSGYGQQYGGAYELGPGR